MRPVGQEAQPQVARRRNAGTGRGLGATPARAWI